jgi:hypothetical protein
MRVVWYQRKTGDQFFPELLVLLLLPVTILICSFDFFVKKAEENCHYFLKITHAVRPSYSLIIARMLLLSSSPLEVPVQQIEGCTSFLKLHFVLLNNRNRKFIIDSLPRVEVSVEY